MSRTNGSELCRAIRTDQELCGTPWLSLPPFRDGQPNASHCGMHGRLLPDATNFSWQPHGFAGDSEVTSSTADADSSHQRMLVGCS